jgi:hypothetical protein
VDNLLLTYGTVLAITNLKSRIKIQDLKKKSGIIRINYTSKDTIHKVTFTKSERRNGTQLAQVSKLINDDNMSGIYANNNNKKVHYITVLTIQ